MGPSHYGYTSLYPWSYNRYSNCSQHGFANHFVNYTYCKKQIPSNYGPPAVSICGNTVVEPGETCDCVPTKISDWYYECKFHWCCKPDTCTKKQFSNCKNWRPPTTTTKAATVFTWPTTQSTSQPTTQSTTRPTTRLTSPLETTTLPTITQSTSTSTISTKGTTSFRTTERPAVTSKPPQTSLLTTMRATERNTRDRIGSRVIAVIVLLVITAVLCASFTGYLYWQSRARAQKVAFKMGARWFIVVNKEIFCTTDSYS